MAKNAVLANFIKHHCAQWDSHHGGCLFKKVCLVLEGKPCDYLETILGAPDYQYRHSGFDWQKLFDEYGKINPDFQAQKVRHRKCPGCGAALPPRRKYCDKCRQARQRANNRKRQSRFRANVTL